jgi:hypothetical protein
LILGLAYAFTLFKPSFILGQNPYWTAPFGDRITNLIGALYFVHDSWRFPIFHIPKLAFPEGANIVYTDSLPLLALAAKAVFKLTGKWINYFPVWEFACFPLLAWFTGLAAREGGAKNILTVLCAALFALSSPALLYRFAHTALMGQFLIVWSFYLYLRLTNHPQSKAVIAQFCIVAALSILVQAYFLLMVMPFLFAALAQTVTARRISPQRAVLNFATFMATILMTALIAGIIGRGSSGATAWGFGHYSMNVLSPFIPPRDHLPAFISRHIGWDEKGYTWDATGGQYEGYNYLGAGVIFLLAVHFFASRDLVKQTLKRHLFLAFALAGLILLALSNRVFLGHWKIIEAPVIRGVRWISEHFRTSGRMFWPTYYVLAITLVLGTVNRFNSRVAWSLLVIATSLQLADTQLLRRNLAADASKGFAPELSQEVWKPLLEAHQFLKQYPSFQCGGWAGGWPENNSNMELLWMAAKQDLPTNSAYLGRLNRNCAEELSEGLKFNLESEGLYIYGKNFPINQIESMPGFQDWCRKFKFGVVCSLNWPKFSQAALKQDFSTISEPWTSPHAH